MDWTELSVEEIKQGYRFVKEQNKYICNTCGREFFTGEIYQFGSRFFDSANAVQVHLATEHDTIFKQLITSESKYLGLTENQKTLLELINSSMSDNEIAKKTGVTPSTIRHQKFMFREKAKQAKMYLALYDLALKNNPVNENLVHVHSTATMVDDRYITTAEERDKIIRTSFRSLSPLKLIAFPAKEKKKIIVLKRIMEEFQPGKVYQEKEVNGILKGIFEDYPTLRRYLIEYGFMERTDDCKEYRVKFCLRVEGHEHSV